MTHLSRELMNRFCANSGSSTSLYPKRHGPQTWADEDINDPQPEPEHSHHPAIWPLVVVDMLKRDIAGEKKYGTRLKGFNGRDPLVDAYQESLDLCCYLRQAIYERDRKEENVQHE